MQDIYMFHANSVDPDQNSKCHLDRQIRGCTICFPMCKISWSNFRVFMGILENYPYIGDSGLTLPLAILAICY